MGEVITVTPISMSEGLSIEQLADLKVALNRAKDELRKTEDDLAIAKQEHEHRLTESIRLKADVDEKVAQIEQLRKDRDALEEEKAAIKSKFEIESAKKYEDLRKAEADVSSQTQTNALRLIEIDKREKALAAREAEIERRTVENRRVLEDANAQLLAVEEKRKEAEAALSKAEAAKKAAEEARFLVEDANSQLEATRASVNADRAEVESLTAKYSAKVAEANAAESRAKAETDYLKRLLPVIEEAKSFIIDKTRKNGTVVELSDLEAILTRAVAETQQEEAKESVENLTNEENVAESVVEDIVSEEPAEIAAEESVEAVEPAKKAKKASKE